MTVSIKSTGKKYHGAMAANYETKRKKQERWDIENDVVAKMLKKLRPKSVLDVPCGTGRFLPTYDKIGVKHVLAVDISDSMLLQAAEKAKRCKNRKGITLKCKDILLMHKVPQIDVSVCVRFLDLIDQAAMRDVMTKLFKITDEAIICTIRLGEQYIPKSNTATHDQKDFYRRVKKSGWRVKKSVPVFNQGWVILLLVRR